MSKVGGPTAVSKKEGVHSSISVACVLRLLHSPSQHNCLEVGTDLYFKAKATEGQVGSVT